MTRMDAGLPLPFGLVQPFFLRFRSDDFHVMAFFRHHPVYEAVEAMIARRGDGTFAARAILTRHDQTQIDHVNDEALLAAARGAAREIYESAIDVAIGDENGKPRITVAFTSFAGERIVLDLIAVAQPSAAGAGLTDPGRHSPNASLPIMWRGRSALAAPETRVEIDGRAFAVPEKLRTASFIAQEGYFTEHHAMGAFRAGTETLRLVQAPKGLEPGASWLYHAGGEERRYEITAREAGGSLAIERAGPAREVISAREEEKGLALRSILVPADARADGGLMLSFEENRFAVVIEGVTMISGRHVLDGHAGETRIRLLPETPSWAMPRAVDLTCTRRGNVFELTTRIGDANI